MTIIKIRSQDTGFVVGFQKVQDKLCVSYFSDELSLPIETPKPRLATPEENILFAHMIALVKTTMGTLQTKERELQATQEKIDDALVRIEGLKSDDTEDNCCCHFAGEIENILDSQEIPKNEE